MSRNEISTLSDLNTVGLISSALIIDDDEIIIYLTGALIKKEEFCNRTETFTDGLQAIKRLKLAIETNVDLPQVILFDLNMPVMDGWEFVDEYMKLGIDKSIPLFVFTSSINPADKEKLFSYSSIKGFIQKPLTKQKLDKILRIIS